MTLASVSQSSLESSKDYYFVYGKNTQTYNSATSTYSFDHGIRLERISVYGGYQKNTMTTKSSLATKYLGVDALVVFKNPNNEKKMLAYASSFHSDPSSTSSCKLVSVGMIDLSSSTGSEI